MGAITQTWLPIRILLAGLSCLQLPPRATHTYSRSPLRGQPRNPGLGLFHTIRRSARGSCDNLKQALSDALLTLSERRTSTREQTCSRRLPFPPFRSLQACPHLCGRPSPLAFSPWNARDHTVAGRSMSPSVDASNVSSAARQSPTSGVTVERSSCCLSRPLSLVLHRPAKPTGFLA